MHIRYTHTPRAKAEAPEYSQRIYTHNMIPRVCYDKFLVHTLKSEKSQKAFWLFVCNMTSILVLYMINSLGSFCLIIKQVVVEDTEHRIIKSSVPLNSNPLIPLTLLGHSERILRSHRRTRPHANARKLAVCRHQTEQDKLCKE